MRRRFVPVVIESAVIVILLAGFIHTAVTTANGTGVCAPADEGNDGGESGDGDDAGNDANRACSLTKGATGMTVSVTVSSSPDLLMGRRATFCPFARPLILSPNKRMTRAGIEKTDVIEQGPGQKMVG